MDPSTIFQEIPSRRVAIFTFSYAPLMTGISAIVHDRIEVLLRAGHSVHLVHPDTSNCRIDSVGMYGLSDLEALGNFSSATFRTVRNPVRHSWPEAASFRVWNELEKLESFEPDLILVDDAPGIFGAASACIGGYKRSIGVACGRHFRVPVLNLIHGDWRSYAEQHVGRFAVGLCWPLIKMRMRRVTVEYDLNISPSAYLASRYADFYRDRIEHIQFHGVNCDDFKPDNIKCSVMSDMAGPVIVSSGRVAREKNVLDLLVAFRHVKKVIPAATLVVLGDGPLLPKLRQMADAEFGTAVRTPGAVFGDALKWWLARADVYWTASVTENFSMGILEALASGTPVVTYSAGGNIEQVEDGISGLHAIPSVPAELADRAIRLLQDDDLRSRLSDGARQRALVFSNERCVQRLMNRVFGKTGLLPSRPEAAVASH